VNDVSTALRAVAEYQLQHPDSGFVVTLPPSLTPAEMAERGAEVRRISAELQALADEAKARPISYDEFDALRRQYQPLGKLPLGALVSEVARAITAAEVVRLYG
jgi:hypothetical protein